MSRSLKGCPILEEKGCYDTNQIKETASLCTDCPMPFCVFDYETKQGFDRKDVHVAVLWYSGKSVQEIAQIIGWRLKTVENTLAKWQERSKELMGVA